jgi:hypothetical protein
MFPGLHPTAMMSTASMNVGFHGNANGPPRPATSGSNHNYHQQESILRISIPAEKFSDKFSSPNCEQFSTQIQHMYIYIRIIVNDVKF